MASRGNITPQPYKARGSEPYYHTHRARRSPDGLLFVLAGLCPPAVDHRERRMTRRHTLRIGRRLDKLSNRPDMIGHAQRHRWRHAYRLMDTAEIVMRDEQRHSRLVVPQLLAEPAPRRLASRFEI